MCVWDIIVVVAVSEIRNGVNRVRSVDTKKKGEAVKKNPTNCWRTTSWRRIYCTFEIQWKVEQLKWTTTEPPMVAWTDENVMDWATTRVVRKWCRFNWFPSVLVHWIFSTSSLAWHKGRHGNNNDNNNDNDLYFAVKKLFNYLTLVPWCVHAQARDDPWIRCSLQEKKIKPISIEITHSLHFTWVTQVKIQYHNGNQ